MNKKLSAGDEVWFAMQDYNTKDGSITILWLEGVITAIDEPDTCYIDFIDDDDGEQRNCVRWKKDVRQKMNINDIDEMIKL